MKNSSLLQPFFITLKRDLVLALRNPRDIINPLLFFIIIVTLFPLAITPNWHFLQQIAAGIIWVAALLATLLAIDRLFRNDYLDGSLEQLLLSPYPLPLLIFGKICAHWLQTSVPLLLLSPILALMLHLPSATILALLVCLLLGTPILNLVASIAVALTVGIENGSILLSLLVLPLYVPVLVFGSGTVLAALHGLPILGDLALLGAILCLALVTVPFATAAALRIGMNV